MPSTRITSEPQESTSTTSEPCTLKKLTWVCVWTKTVLLGLWMNSKTKEPKFLSVHRFLVSIYIHMYDWWKLNKERSIFSQKQYHTCVISKTLFEKKYIWKFQKIRIWKVLYLRSSSLASNSRNYEIQISEKFEKKYFVYKKVRYLLDNSYLVFKSSSRLQENFTS